jgi:hypothetical protein
LDSMKQNGWKLMSDGLEEEERQADMRERERENSLRPEALSLKGSIY